jgi:O-antigen/teichoic acid export membrane protein
MSFLRKAILVNSTHITCLGIGIGQMVLLSRILGPDGVGQYAVFLSALMLTAQLASLGIPISFLFHSQREQDKSTEYLANTVWSMVVTGFAGGLILTAAIFAFPSYFGRLPWYGLVGTCLYVPVALQAVVGRNQLMLAIEARRLSALTLFADLANITLIACFCLFDWLGPSEALLCFVTAACIRASLGWYWMRRHFAIHIKPSFALTDRLLRMGLRQSWADLMVLVNGQVGILLVKYLCDDFVSVGYFSRGLRMALLAVTAGQAVLPLLFSRWAACSEAELTRHVEKVLRFASTFSLIMLAMLWLTGRLLVLLLLGGEFLPAVGPMMILVPGAVLYLLSRTLMQVVGSRGTPEISAGMLFFTAALNAALTWWLVPRTGIEGAAWASTAGNIVLLAGMFLIVRRRYHVRLGHSVLMRVGDLRSLKKSLGGERGIHAG